LPKWTTRVLFQYLLKNTWLSLSFLPLFHFRFQPCVGRTAVLKPVHIFCPGFSIFSFLALGVCERVYIMTAMVVVGAATSTTIVTPNWMITAPMTSNTTSGVRIGNKTRGGCGSRDRGSGGKSLMGGGNSRGWLAQVCSPGLIHNEFGAKFIKSEAHPNVGCNSHKNLILIIQAINGVLNQFLISQRRVNGIQQISNIFDLPKKRIHGFRSLLLQVSKSSS